MKEKGLDYVYDHHYEITYYEEVAYLFENRLLDSYMTENDVKKLLEMDSVLDYFYDIFMDDEYGVDEAYIGSIETAIGRLAYEKQEDN